MHARLLVPGRDQRPTKEVDGMDRSAPLRDRALDETVDQLGRRRSSECPVRAVDDQRPESVKVVGREKDERTDPPATSEFALGPSQGLDRSREDRPEGRDPTLPFWKKPVGVPERPKDRTEVRPSDADVVQDEDARPCLAAKPTEKTGEDLRDRKPPSVEPVVDQYRARRKLRRGSPGTERYGERSIAAVAPSSTSARGPRPRAPRVGPRSWYRTLGGRPPPPSKGRALEGAGGRGVERRRGLRSRDREPPAAANRRRALRGGAWEA